jgi:hypothetical protein
MNRERTKSGGAAILDPSRAIFDDRATESDLEQLAAGPRLKVLQCDKPVTNPTWDRVNRRFFALRPDVELRVYGYYEEPCDLSFARRMTNVRRFSADCLMKATNVEAIAEIPHLESLSLGIFELKDFRILDLIPRGLTQLSLQATRSK